MYRVVFDVSMEGAEKWEGTLRNVDNLRRALGARNIEVQIVVYGKALPLLLTRDSNGASAALTEPLQSLSRSGVRLTACENTMKRMNVGRGRLLPFAQTVDSGVAELVRKQAAGWAYIKAGG